MIEKSTLGSHLILLCRKAPWILRLTDHKGKPSPVFVIKERWLAKEEKEDTGGEDKKTILRDRGLLYGSSLRRCLPVLRTILAPVCDYNGIPLELQRLLPNGRIKYRGNLPLDEEAGVKLALLFKLQERIRDMDRVELIAWRVERFSREEALYWLTRALGYGNTASRWAQSGMRIILGGQPGAKGINDMLAQLRR